jgi:exopolysaccharide/PEP-CTERM locus tyrosine autokinase
VSKIQQALQRLQQKQAGNEDTAVSSAEQGMDEQVTATTRKPEIDASGDAAESPALDAADAAADLKPVFNVDVASLRESGLLPPLEASQTLAEEFRRIKRPLLANAQGHEAALGQHMNVIMIGSAMPASGKTFCSVNLAMSLSMERNRTVLLVDADVAKPHISREFGLDDRPGLLDLLDDPRASISDAIVRTDLNDIRVLPAGTRHAEATELLASDQMKSLIHELSTRYPDRIIVVDTPPLLLTSEAHALATQVGQIVIVVESGQTGQQSLSQALDTLDPSKPINLVLNKSRFSTGGGYYGGYYNNYGYGD